MAIYRQGKKVTGIYRDGRAVTGIYRDGKKLWDKGTPQQVYGLIVEPVSVSDGMYLEHALKNTSSGQSSNYVDVPLGSKTVRVAGDGIGVVKGKLINGYLTWDSVKITDEDVWIGKELPVRMHVSSVSIKCTDVTWTGENMGEFKFNSVGFSPSTKIVLYKYGESSGKQAYAYEVWANDGLLSEVRGEWSVVSREVNRYTLSTGSDIEVLEGENNVRVVIENTGLKTGSTKQQSCGLFVNTPSLYKTVYLRVKGLIR